MMMMMMLLMMMMMMMMMIIIIIIIIIIICYQLFKYVFTFRSVNNFTLYIYPNHCDIHSDTHKRSNIVQFAITFPTLKKLNSRNHIKSIFLKSNRQRYSNYSSRKLGFPQICFLYYEISK